MNAAGGAVNVTFDGNYCAWIAKKGPGCGKAMVVLDGGAPVYVDLYASRYDRYRQKVYNTGYLADGSHTLSIYWIGQRYAYSYSSRINVDAFEVYENDNPTNPTLTGPTRAAPIPWRYEQNDARLTVLGNWVTSTDAYASGGNLLTTWQAGSAVVAKFDGTAFKLIGKVGTGYGLAEVIVDDGAPIEVDFWNATTVRKKVFDLPGFSGLDSGEHTVVIRCKGQPSLGPGRTGIAIGVDALDVTGWLAAAPTAARVEQDGTPAPDPELAFSATYDPVAWTTATEASASGASLASVNAAGGKVTVTFTGTNLTWLAKASKYMGKATVSLYDGDESTGTLLSTTTVDLYSYYNTYKKVVYKTPMLENIAHTVVIEWTGTKNASSWGTAINVDAFDILGEIWAPAGP